MLSRTYFGSTRGPFGIQVGPIEYQIWFVKDQFWTHLEAILDRLRTNVESHCGIRFKFDKNATRRSHFNTIFQYVFNYFHKDLKKTFKLNVFYIFPLEGNFDIKDQKSQKQKNGNMSENIFKIYSYIHKMTPNLINALKMSIRNTKTHQKHKNTFHLFENVRKHLIKKSKKYIYLL